MRILQRPAHAGEPFIIGVNGCLRIIDPPRDACVAGTCGNCVACKDRADKHTRRHGATIAVLVCVCENPITGAEGRCEKCGRPPLTSKAAA